MPQTNVRPNKVLVVDDDVRIRDLLRRYLMQ
jgi:two-component system phosphate regulon response regulator OmpR